jgi:hypothetical protein
MNTGANLINTRIWQSHLFNSLDSFDHRIKSKSLTLNKFLRQMKINKRMAATHICQSLSSIF